jgi:uncharacterized protein YneF (UPF0154 family)
MKHWNKMKVVALLGSVLLLIVGIVWGFLLLQGSVANNIPARQPSQASEA